MYWVYVLKDKASGRLYIGSTEDMERRLTEHSRKRPPFNLVLQVNVPTKNEALRREKYLKSGNGRRSLKNLIVGSPATRQADERL
jgi:putative endonuclease